MSVYDTMKFPSYIFREYPKWVKINGQEVIVNSQREEIALIATTPEAAQDDPVVIEKNRLAEELAKAQEELTALRAAKAADESAKKDVATGEKIKPVDVPVKSVSEALKKG